MKNIGSRFTCFIALQTVCLVSVFLVIYGCGGGKQTEYETTPTANPISVTVDATGYFEVLESTIEKTGDGYLGKAKMKALVNLNSEKISLLYKPLVWTKEGIQELPDKTMELKGPIAKEQTVEVKLPFSAEGGEGGRTINIWMVSVSD